MCRCVRRVCFFDATAVFRAGEAGREPPCLGEVCAVAAGEGLHRSQGVFERPQRVRAGALARGHGRGLRSFVLVECCVTRPMAAKMRTVEDERMVDALFANAPWHRPFQWMTISSMATFDVVRHTWEQRAGKRR